MLGNRVEACSYFQRSGGGHTYFTDCIFDQYTTYYIIHNISYIIRMPSIPIPSHSIISYSKYVHIHPSIPTYLQ